MLNQISKCTNSVMFSITSTTTFSKSFRVKKKKNNNNSNNNNNNKKGTGKQTKKIAIDYIEIFIFLNLMKERVI